MRRIGRSRPVTAGVTRPNLLVAFTRQYRPADRGFRRRRRLLGKNYVDSDDDSLYQVVKEKYRESFACAGKINRHIEKHYQHQLTTEEMMFLTIHIERVRSESEEKPA